MQTKVDEIKITAATDAAGSHVMVVGPNMHYISEQLPDHESAVKVMWDVIKGGLKAYRDWRHPDSCLGEIFLNVIASAQEKCDIQG